MVITVEEDAELFEQFWQENVESKVAGMMAAMLKSHAKMLWDKSREKILGKANAWDSVKDFMDSLEGENAILRDKIREELFNDGCMCASTHLIYFISALLEERNDEC